MTLKNVILITKARNIKKFIVQIKIKLYITDIIKIQIYKS